MKESINEKLETVWRALLPLVSIPQGDADKKKKTGNLEKVVKSEAYQGLLKLKRVPSLEEIKKIIEKKEKISLNLTDKKKFPRKPVSDSRILLAAALGRFSEFEEKNRTIPIITARKNPLKKEAFDYAARYGHFKVIRHFILTETDADRVDQMCQIILSVPLLPDTAHHQHIAESLLPKEGLLFVNHISIKLGNNATWWLKKKNTLMKQMVCASVHEYVGRMDETLKYIRGLVQLLQDRKLVRFLEENQNLICMRFLRYLLHRLYERIDEIDVSKAVASSWRNSLITACAKIPIHIPLKSKHLELIFKELKKPDEQKNESAPLRELRKFWNARVEEGLVAHTRKPYGMLTDNRKFGLIVRKLADLLRQLEVKGPLLPAHELRMAQAMYMLKFMAAGLKSEGQMNTIIKAFDEFLRKKKISPAGYLKVMGAAYLGHAHGECLHRESTKCRIDTYNYVGKQIATVGGHLLVRRNCDLQIYELRFQCIERSMLGPDNVLAKAILWNLERAKQRKFYFFNQDKQGEWGKCLRQAKEYFGFKDARERLVQANKQAIFRDFLTIEKGAQDILQMQVNLKIRAYKENDINISEVKDSSKEGLPFHCIRGHRVDILIALPKEIKLNSKNIDGRTPLHIAALLGKIDAIYSLGKRKLQFDAKDRNGDTPLHLAVKNRHFDTVKEIFRVVKKELQKLLHMPNNRGENVFHLAANCGSLEMLKLFSTKLKIKSDSKPEEKEHPFNAKDRAWNRPLHHAAAHGYSDAVSYLAKKPTIDVNVRNKSGQTPAHLAAYRGHLNVLKALVESKANLTLGDREGNSPLHLAARGGHRNVFMFLGNKNPELLSKKIKGKTPWDLFRGKPKPPSKYKSKSDWEKASKSRLRAPSYCRAN